MFFLDHGQFALEDSLLTVNESGVSSGPGCPDSRGRGRPCRGDSPIERIAADDRLRDAPQECLAALRHAAGLFDLKAAPKRELSAFPAIREFSRDVERLLAVVDRVVPKSVSG